MSQRIVLRVEVPDDAEHQPTVQEVFHQLLDLVDLAEEGGPAVWKLVSVSKKSPLTVVAEATARSPGVVLDSMAVARQVESFTQGIRDVERGRLPSQWQTPATKKLVKNILTRTARSLPNTQVSVGVATEGETQVPQATISATTITSDLLLRLDEDVTPPTILLGPAKTQIGEVSGSLVEVKTYYHHPAIVIRERISGEAVLCLVTESDREKIAGIADFDDVWRERRVLVTGKIEFNASRQIDKVTATSVKLLEDRTVDSESLRQPGFTDGLTPEEYLARLREGTLG